MLEREKMLLLQLQEWGRRAIVHPWVRRLILIGYAAKGFLYFLIGWLSLKAALFRQETAAGTYTALDTVLRRPLGRVLLCVLAVGLLGYVLRRLLQALVDPGHTDSRHPFRLGHRLGYVMSGFSYAGIAITAAKLTMGRGEDDDMVEDFASEFFDLPFGEWIVLLIGLAVIGIGLSYLYGAYSGSYISEFQPYAIHPRLERWAIYVGKVGVAARGVAFILIGAFLSRAALFGNLDSAGGLENAFRTLQSQPLGPLWLSLVGLGFIAYGLYMWVAARYRRFAVR